jgi:cytidine deaminase
MAFGPKDLGFARGALPAKINSLLLTTEISDPAVILALNAAKKAYSPYTNSPSGVSVRTSDGRLFSGAYIENAAFNPSLPPLQAALAGVFASGEDAAAISRVALVELEGAPISQQSGTRATLSSLAPAAHVEVFAARWR